LFPKSQSDYGLMFGVGSMLSTLVETIIPDGASGLRDTLKGVLENFDLNSLTHNRMYIPGDAEYLRFSAWSPLNLLEDSHIEIVFTKMDGTVSEPQTVRLQSGFFDSHE